VKKTLFFLTIAILLTCFYGCDKSESFLKVTTAVENTNAKQRYQAKYVVDMKFPGAILTFEQGSYSIDRQQKKLYLNGVKSYLGTSKKLIEMYSEGYVYTDLDGAKSKAEIVPEKFFNYLYYAQAFDFKYEDIKKLSVDTNSSGTLYTFTVESGYDKQLLALMGDDVYSLARITKPQTEKTRFSEIKCEYTVTDNKNGEPILAGSQIAFTMFLYDTPAYTPGYTPPENDYMLELSVRLNVSYTAFGDEVSIEAPVVRDYSLVK